MPHVLLTVVERAGEQLAVGVKHFAEGETGHY